MNTIEIIVTVAISATITLGYTQTKALAERGAEETAKGWEQRVSTAEALQFAWAPQARKELEAGKQLQREILAGIPEEAPAG